MSDLEARIRKRAHSIWVDEGRPSGRDQQHWEMAKELVAIEDSQVSTLKSPTADLGPYGEPVEPVEAVENAGEFPTLTDQGEAQIPKQPNGVP